MAAAPERTLTYAELDVLHCLRGFCAFYVVVYHARRMLWAGGHEYLARFPRAGWSVGEYATFGLDMLSAAGYEMVIAFFVLSGFFIRHAQLRKRRPPLAFYQNRAVRLYPPYLASVVLAVAALALLVRFAPAVLSAAHPETSEALTLAAADLQHPRWTNAVRTLLFLPLGSNVAPGYNAVYWSLLPEALFYLLVPLAFWRIRAYYILSLVLGILGLLASAVHYQASSVGDFLLTFNLYFAVGCLLYDAVRRPGWLAWFGRVRGAWLAAAALALAGLLLGLAALKWRAPAGLAATALTVLAVSVLLAGRVGRRHWAVRLFHPVGVFSFSLYLYHFPLLLLAAGWLTVRTGAAWSYARYYWLAVPPIVLICYALYWLTERVSVRFFRRV